MAREDDLATIKAAITTLPTDKWDITDGQMEAVFDTMATVTSISTQDRLFLISDMATRINIVSIAMIHIYNLYCEGKNDAAYTAVRI